MQDPKSKSEYRRLSAQGAIMFIPGEAEGAIPNGCRIKKVVTEKGDAHPVGAKGEIVASHGPLKYKDGQGIQRDGFGYFVMWDDMPGMPVFTAGFKVEEI